MVGWGRKDELSGEEEGARGPDRPFRVSFHSCVLFLPFGNGSAGMDFATGQV